MAKVRRLLQEDLSYRQAETPRQEHPQVDIGGSKADSLEEDRTAENATQQTSNAAIMSSRLQKAMEDDGLLQQADDQEAPDGRIESGGKLAESDSTLEKLSEYLNGSSNETTDRLKGTGGNSADASPDSGKPDNTQSSAGDIESQGQPEPVRFPSKSIVQVSSSGVMSEDTPTFTVTEDVDSLAPPGASKYENEAESEQDSELQDPLGHEDHDSRVEYKGLRSWRRWRDNLDIQIEPGNELKPVNTRIHILGLGASGKYIAHSLAKIPSAPPITLLMHRPLDMQRWHDEGACIRVQKGDDVEVQSNFEIESSADFHRIDSNQRFPGFGPNLEHTAEPPTYPIESLIVTTDPSITVSALTSIKHRLHFGSTLALVNDGLGLVELINEKVFPDISQRPTYILGNMTHHLDATARHFTIVEKKPGQLQCSKLPQNSISHIRPDDLSNGRSPVIRRKDFSWTAQASALVGNLARTPEFSTKPVGHKTFSEFQLLNLVSQAVIGPLSVVFDCTNDELLYNYDASQAMKRLIREISWLIRALPEYQATTNIRRKFAEARLEAITVSKIKRTGKNSSEMRNAVRAGRKTNIDFFNGYLERRAAELRINMPNNAMLIDIVKGKQQMKSRERKAYIPFADGH